jgi:leucyl aminopeptidase (aminopeptidase T)
LGEKRGFSVKPLLSYAATGAHNGPLPSEGEMDGRAVRLEDVLADTNIAVALTEFSATASLSGYTREYPDLRAASMPGVTRAMERTALAADYDKVARKAHVLAERLDRATGAELEFSTGHRLYVDLRYRQAHADDGRLHAGREGARVINLPSGEAYVAPYEGELHDQPSRTAGLVPAPSLQPLVVQRIDENRVVEVIGESRASDELRAWFDVDAARRNLAELGLGCNDRAVVTGNVLEDEKVLGVHLAYGRSEHIGGTLGVEAFSDAAHVVHWDIVYPNDGPVEVASLVLEYEDGTREEIMRDGEYTIFSD